MHDPGQGSVLPIFLKQWIEIIWGHLTIIIRFVDLSFCFHKSLKLASEYQPYTSLWEDMYVT